MNWFDENKAAHRETPEGARVERAIQRARDGFMCGTTPKRITGVDAGRSFLILTAGRLLATYTEPTRAEIDDLVAVVEE